MIVTTSHATYIKDKLYEAPANTIIETLQNLKSDFLFFRHAIAGDKPSQALFYKDGILTREIKLPMFIPFAPIAYGIQTLFMLTICIFFIKPKFSFIGIDPLNAFTGFLLKKIGLVTNFVYFTPDYTEKRFKNKLMNSIYHKLDKLCVFSSDVVWNVSSRIQSIRTKMGLHDDRNILLPNTPSNDFKKFLENTKNKDKYSLITLGVISEQLDFENIFLAVKELKSEFPLKMIVIGDGPLLSNYKKIVTELDLDSTVKFLGHLNHEDALKEISQAGVGLALYNGKWGFNYYGDSMKCREFFCFGLPVITTNTHSTADEITKHNCGVICEVSKEAYITALKTIFADYNAYEKNAYELARKYEGIHEKLLKSIQ